MEAQELYAQQPTPAPQPIGTPQPATGKNNTLLVVVGVLFVVGVLYFLMKKSSGKPTFEGSGNSKKDKPQLQQQQQQQQSTPTVIYQNAPTVTTGGGNYVVTWGLYSADLKKSQELMLKEGYKLPIYGADGYLGQETVNALNNGTAPYGKELAAAILTTRGITKDQMKWLLKPYDTPKADTKADTKKISEMNDMQVRAYITNSITSYIGFGWGPLSLKQWAQAIFDEKDSFLCSECTDKGTYQTYRKK